MPYLSPTTLTRDEQQRILRATTSHPRDHLIVSMALGTGLRLAELVGLDVRDVLAPDGTPRSRVRFRREIAKGGRAADVFLPDRIVGRLKRFRKWKREPGENLSEAKVTVHPDDAKLDFVVDRIPAVGGDSSVGVVAGARYVPIQIGFVPPEAFVIGPRSTRIAAQKPPP